MEEFQLTRLMRGVTDSGARGHNGNDRFQLTRLMRGVTDYEYDSDSYSEISTHTPHARRDLNVE